MSFVVYSLSKKLLSMSQTISCKSNFSQTDCYCLRMFPYEAIFRVLSVLSRFSKKYRHISKTRVFEKRFSQLHCVICCLFTVKKLLSMSHTISCKSNITQTVCYCLRMFPYEAIFRVLSVLSRFFKISSHL